MDFSILPSTVSELVEWLDKLYPERSPDPDDSEREIWMRVGERRLVRSLIAKLAATEKTEMEYQTLKEND
jgi:hypothetical protein